MKTTIFKLSYLFLFLLSASVSSNENYQVYSELHWNEISDNNAAGSAGFVVPVQSRLSINVGYKDYGQSNSLYNSFSFDYEYSVISASLEYEFFKSDNLSTFVGIGIESSLKDVPVIENGILQKLIGRGENAPMAYLGAKIPINDSFGVRFGVGHVDRNGIASATESVFLGFYGNFGKKSKKDKMASEVTTSDRRQSKYYARPANQKRLGSSAHTDSQPYSKRNTLIRVPDINKKAIPNRRNETPLVCLQVGRYQQKQSMDKVAELAKKNGITLFTAKDPATNDYLLMSQQTREQKQKMADKIYLDMGIKTFTAKCQQPV